MSTPSGLEQFIFIEKIGLVNGQVEVKNVIEILRPELNK